MTRPLPVLGFRRLVYEPTWTPFEVIGGAVWHWPPGNPPLLIAALQHDQHACKLRIQIAHATTRACSLGSSHLAFSSGAFAGPQPEQGSGHDDAPGGRYLFRKPS
jgi:hypothetical protein